LTGFRIRPLMDDKNWLILNDYSICHDYLRRPGLTTLIYVDK